MTHYAVDSPEGEKTRAATKVWMAVLGRFRDHASLVYKMRMAHPAISLVGISAPNHDIPWAGQPCPSLDEIQNAVDGATGTPVRPLMLRRRTYPDFAQTMATNTPAKIEFAKPGDAEGYRIVR
jgi:hypothetical protein